MEIKNIILDIGGVLIDLDYYKSYSAFEKIGLSNFEKLFNPIYQSQLFQLYETGKLNTSQFISELKTISKKDNADFEIIEAWNAMLLNIPQSRVNTLLRLKGKYKCFLLSNINPLHEAKFKQEVQKVINWNGFVDIFENIYLSYKVGMRKPDSNFYHLVLNENRLKAHETLLIDDSNLNINGAIQCQINTILADKSNDFESVIKKTCP
jgi:glucose-1-phosphatase